MDETTLRSLLLDVASGDCPPDEAVRRLRTLPFTDLGFARVDHHRALRQMVPEAVYGPGKQPEHCAAIVLELLAGSGGPVILTRADEAQVSAACDGASSKGFDQAEITPTGALFVATWRPAPSRPDAVIILTAGTSDLPVGNECRAVLSVLGFDPTLIADCGVAGIHRLLDVVDTLLAADVVVVIAGMEGALASVVGGLTPAPVVAVPTSTGYGTSFDGITALLSMLATCAAGVTVVGIDNGFGAAAAVARFAGLPEGSCP